jgi:hypothetical protein
MEEEIKYIQQCTICLEEMLKEEEETVTTSCGHCFHTLCFEKYETHCYIQLDEFDIPCPNCRTSQELLVEKRLLKENVSIPVVLFESTFHSSSGEEDYDDMPPLEAVDDNEDMPPLISEEELHREIMWRSLVTQTVTQMLTSPGGVL